jgi:hypothetical protein
MEMQFEKEKKYASKDMVHENAENSYVINASVMEIDSEKSA